MPALLVTRQISVPRFVSFLSRYPRAESKFFTPEELAYCYRFKKGLEERLAARLAAKLAVKSVCLGLKWTELSIVNDVLGAPSILMPNASVKVRSLSLSHDKQWAVAAALLTHGGNITRE